jgi:hypothetical protein
VHQACGKEQDNDRRWSNQKPESRAIAIYGYTDQNEHKRKRDAERTQIFSGPIAHRIRSLPGLWLALRASIAYDRLCLCAHFTFPLRGSIPSFIERRMNDSLQDNTLRDLCGLLFNLFFSLQA